MALTQRQITNQMVAQLRLLDPAVSAEIGTPERKILDTVAQAIADSQVDLAALQGALDLESKFGANLDRFIGLFGFARKRAEYATGYVEFGRLVASNTDIRIPSNTRVQAIANGSAILFHTTGDVLLVSGQTSVIASVRAVTPGASGNVAAGTILTPVGEPIIGITVVENPLPTRGGVNAEDDDRLKARFKNQIFRNLAGTEDQYLALAAATPFATKANVVGPISRYQEYIQVPEVDDATAYDINGDNTLEAGNGEPGEYTSALSSIPFAKYTYDNVPLFVSNGESGAGSVFYRRDVDFRVNFTGTTKFKGDTFRLSAVGRGPNPLSDSTTNYQPNISFTNVYTGTTPAVTAVRPNQVVLFEHSYLSSASRNDVSRNITNCVDVYINGGNEAEASVILPNPTSAQFLVDDPASKYHYDNYRRKGQPETRPMILNLLMPLVNQPILSLPATITAEANGNTYVFTQGVHFWPVEDVTIIGGSIRSRSGVEWSMDIPATHQNGSSLFINDPAITAITISNYTFDKAVIELQAALDGAKQVTTDVLAHRARRRYFKLDITVMYSPGVSISDTNLQIQNAVSGFLENSYFGATIQLSDLLQEIHNTFGVDNVRWTSDVPGDVDLHRMMEVDEFGRPLINLNVRRQRAGTGSLAEIQHIVLSGNPTAGNFALNYNDAWTAALPYTSNAAAIYTALTSAPVNAPVATVTGLGTPQSPFVVTFSGTGMRPLIKGTPQPQRVVSVTPLVNGQRNLYSRDYTFNTDFFLKDDELPFLATTKDESTPGAIVDTTPGLIIRPRAQNTWNRQ